MAGRAIEENDASGSVARIYHQIRQSLRVNGVNLNFRTLAAHPAFFEAAWDAMLPNVETRAFEEAADAIRRAAAEVADRLGRLDAAHAVALGGSQQYQIRKALELYRYINPKLLVFMSAVRLALHGEPVGGAATAEVELIARGVPAGMAAMEMVSEPPQEERLRALFEDIRRTLSLPAINSDYRTLALWPDYLEVVWQRLKPLVGRDDYHQAAETLRRRARELARALPYRVELLPARVAALSEDEDEISRTLDTFERLLPPLIVNMALAALDWWPADQLAQSPFPAPPRRAVAREVRR